MTKAKSLASVAVFALIASGCTTVISTAPDLIRTSSPSNALPGISYNLPMLQYQIEITRTLTTCPSEELVNDRGIEAAAKLAFAIEAKATQRYVRGESYVVDYRSLSNHLKTTAFALTPYPTTGNLKTINITAEDQTGDVIKDVVKVGLVVASVAGGPAAIAASTVGAVGSIKNNNSEFNKLQEKSKHNILSSSEFAQFTILTEEDDFKSLQAALAGVPSMRMQIIDCAQATRDLLKSKAAAEDAMKKATAKLEDATINLAKFTLLVGVRGLKVDTRESQATALSGALDAQEMAMKAIKDAKDNFKIANDELALKTSFTWPNRLPERDGFSALSSDDLQKFSGLLLTRDVVLYDTAKFAKALSSFQQTHADAYLRLLKRFPALKGYLLTNGSPIPVAAVPFGHCAPGAADISGCLIESLSLATNLGSVEKDSTNPKDGVEAGQFPVLDSRISLPRKGMVIDATHYVDARELSKEQYPVAKGGIFVRQPIEGRLLVCQTKITSTNTVTSTNTAPGQVKWSVDNGKLIGGMIAPCEKDAANLLVADDDAAPTIAPQLGQLRFLPFRNGPFQSNELKLELEVDGSIKTFEYKHPKAAAALAAAAAADVSKQISDYVEKKRKEKETAYTDAKAKVLADLTYDIERLTKEKTLMEELAGGKADPDARSKMIHTATAIIDAETAQAKAKIERAEALAAVTAYKVLHPGDID